MKRFSAFYLFKIAVTAGLVWLLFSRVDFGGFIAVFSGISIDYFLLAVLALTVGWWLNTLRWKTLLGIFKMRLKTWRLFLYNLISIFYNLVLPGGKVMGDVVRGYQVARDHDGEPVEKHRLFLITFIDRGLGLLGLLILTSFYFIFGHEAITYLGSSAQIVGVAAIIISASGLIVVFSSIFDWIFIPLRKIPLRFTQKIFTTITDSLEICRSGRKQLAGSLVITMLAAIAAGLSVAFLAIGLGIDMRFLNILFFNTLAVVLIVIPITIAGIGLRESGLVYLFVAAGIMPESALALSILNLLVMVVLALMGGLIEFYNHFLKDGFSHQKS
ncbi:MAG: lysylphosphatidylglycerol synthase transmembrane domain-containing protein [bacterium]|nr:lysylphosphatidylglycerol synthase transmembrane domain-containing protein [bacterium]